MKREVYICDICGKDDVDLVMNDFPLQMIFTTETTEGTPTKPYIQSDNKVDVCVECHDKLTSGRYLFAAGAMGSYRYEFAEGHFRDETR
ncbi:MAG: hypothetical protein JRN42_05900 [Nitrososphaerota archaeon]|nr:hypothetical protein [Nitrososphaerota archaeon]